VYRFLISLLVLSFIIILPPAAYGQDLPFCPERPTRLDTPWVDGELWCLEEVFNNSSLSQLPFTSLVTAPDGTLYATLPLEGIVVAFDDTNDDLLPDTMRTVLTDLTLPNGLAYHEDTLYIAGGANIYRWDGTALDVLVDDLPTGGGFWTGGLTVGPDERLYVAIGAPCDACEVENPERGAILSFALDGSDRRLIATGLRHPADVAFHQGVLWTVDTARDNLRNDGEFDELNRVTITDAVPHFGWPYCIGANQVDLFAGTFGCTQAIPAALPLPTHSVPLGLASYNAESFSNLEDSLLIVLAGDSNQASLTGFALAAIYFDGDNPVEDEILLPSQQLEGNAIPISYDEINFQGSGLWPHHPLDVAVSPEGWVYLSVSDGRILALRTQGQPRSRKAKKRMKRELWENKM